MVSGLFSTARELPRLREISSVFVRHGLGDLVRRAGIVTLLERAGQDRGAAAQSIGDPA